MKVILFSAAVLFSACGEAYAETLCERARQHASSTAQLVVLAQQNGITISKEEQVKIDKCFKQQKRKHRNG